MLSKEFSFSSFPITVKKKKILIYPPGYVLSHSVMSDSLRPHGLWLPRLLYPWNFPGKDTGVSCHFLLQGIFPTQEFNPCFLHHLCWQADSLLLSYLGSPYPPVHIINVPFCTFPYYCSLNLLQVLTFSWGTYTFPQIFHPSFSIYRAQSLTFWALACGGLGK